jgi:hypothetical protein
VSPVKYELGIYIPEDGILHSHYRENLKSYNINIVDMKNEPDIFCQIFNEHYHL